MRERGRDIDIAGSPQGARCATGSPDPGSCPELKADAQPLSHPGVPAPNNFYLHIIQFLIQQRKHFLPFWECELICFPDASLHCLWMSIFYHLKTVYQHNARSKILYLCTFNLYTSSWKYILNIIFYYIMKLIVIDHEWKLDYVFCNSTSYFTVWPKNRITTFHNPWLYIWGITEIKYALSFIDKFDLKVHFSSIFLSYDATFSVYFHNCLNSFFSFLL